MILRFQTRLVLWCTATFIALLIGFSVVSYRLLARQLNQDADADIVELTTGLHGYLRFDGGTPALVFDENDADQAAFVRDATRYYQIYDADDGRLLVESQEVEPLGLHFTPAEVREFLDDPTPYDIQTDYGRFRISNSLIAPVSGGRYLLQVGTSLDAMDDALRLYLHVMLWWALPSLLVVVVVVWWMTHTAVAPLTALATEARRVGIATLDHRLPTRGAGDQLDEVATAFNETLSRLEGAVGEMKQFSSALAHELRTPLTALRGEIELTLLVPAVDPELTKRATSQIEEIDRLTRLINQLLTLARAESGEIALARQPVDLAVLATNVSEQLEPVAQARHLDLKCVANQPVMATGDLGWLERCLLNLLDNAIKYTPHGGRVRVCVSYDGDHARVDVRDTGIGMAPGVIPHIFERFYRGDPARSSAVEGAGLGLSLVKWIVDRHDGRIEVQSGIGRGSSFAIWLPAGSVS